MSFPLTVTCLPQSAATGTCFAGYLLTSLDDLFERFGSQFHSSLDGKVQHQWVLSIGGVTVTIYDYKEVPETPSDLHLFHVGSHGATRSAALILLQQIAPDLQVTTR